MKNSTLSAEDLLNAIAQPDITWKAKAEQRKANKESLRRSAKIAFKILDTLRQNRLLGKSPNSQKELAEILNITPQQINKIVKGQENLTLETIARLEDALQVKLIEVFSKSESQHKTTTTSNYVITIVLQYNQLIIPSNNGGFINHQAAFKVESKIQSETKAVGKLQYAMAS